MKWGLVGAGTHAENNVIPGLNASDNNELVGVLGSTAQKTRAFAARHPGCTAYASYEQMLADPTVDAVFIASPKRSASPADGIGRTGRQTCSGGKTNGTGGGRL